MNLPQALLLILLASAVAQADMNLQFVIEMFNHGIKGPATHFYDAPNQTYTRNELLTAGQR